MAGGGNEPPVPAGYTPLKYLQSNGFQWINTGILATIDVKMSCKLKRMNNQRNQWPMLFGASDFGSSNPGFLVCWEGNAITAVSGKSDILIIIDPSTISDDFHTFVLKYMELKIDDTIYIMENTPTWGRINNPICICSSNYHPSAIKVCNFEIENSSQKLYSAKPFLDQTNKPCMYDYISNTPFYNTGSGEFGYEKMDGTYVAPT